ncbi:protein of unknown function [Tranquillimonas rosea]|uniref:DUF4112 domain-containing protein n=1 Tax=Tranquillimonas rosea TaxID=641238 RepID=A0A1H9TFQ5_9RHOB|nr:DUF4112 domain-containing protein [Tranquillimonas rosea]SER95877.1 protein of unknown function [Tranquillimonas rosea]
MPSTSSPSADLAHLERLAGRLDSAFRIPGTGIRFGWDGLLGLIPGIGDFAAAAPAGYIILRAQQLGTPNHVLAQMALNTGIDTVVGTIPLIGDIFDVGWKGNRRNVALLRKHLERTGRLAEPVTTAA